MGTLAVGFGLGFFVAAQLGIEALAGSGLLAFGGLLGWRTLREG